MMHSNKKAVLFARANGGIAAINDQVRALTRYAEKNQIKVVCKVMLPHCSASDYEVESHLTALLGRRRGRSKFSMVMITDLSRLSRRGVPHAMNLIRKLSAAGVSVVTPDLGVVDDRLWKSFPLMPKGWAKWGKNKSLLVQRDRKESTPDASKTVLVACDDEAAGTRGDGPVHGRTPRPHRRDGPPKSYPEERQ